jgi:cbb3-type cytochrome oxidase subunit 3
MEILVKYWWLFAIPAAFIAVVIYVFNPRRKRRLEANAEIPFRDKQTKKKR